MPVNLTSPTPSARPRPGAFIQPRKKPSICHSASRPQAARHHRIALEVAGEEPEVGLDVELGHDLALAVLAAGVGDLHDAVEHQHGRQRQLRVAGPEQVPLGALDQVFEGITVLLLAHHFTVPRPPDTGIGRQNRDAGRPAQTGRIAANWPFSCRLCRCLHMGCDHAGYQPRLSRPACARPACARPGSGWRLARLLFEGGHRHVTAESLHAEVKATRHAGLAGHGLQRAATSSATPACCARSWSAPGRSYFDTNTGHHHHFFVETDGELHDFPSDEVTIAGLPTPPKGTRCRGSTSSCGCAASPPADLRIVCSHLELF